jgi:hypothetical protein
MPLHHRLRILRKQVQPLKQKTSNERMVFTPKNNETVMAALEVFTVYCALTLNIHETNQTRV